MAYNELDPAKFNVGKATKKELWQTVHDNQESFNTDIENLKQTGILDVFNIKFGGDISEYSAAEIAERIPVFRGPVNATMVAFKIVLLTASTSGTLEISLEKSTDDGVNWTPLLNNPVAVTGLIVGSVSSTVDWVDIPSQSFGQGDLLRLVVDGIQVDQGEFHISIYSEVA